MRYTPWFTGGAVAAAVALLLGTLLSGLFLAVAGVNMWLGFALLALGTAGAGPVLVVYRGRPVARFFCAGVAGALAITWVVVIAAAVRGAGG